jgi:hypothetical protein
MMSKAILDTEVREKLAQMRCWLTSYGGGAIRLRGSDWFAWATAGGSNTVLLTSETGVAEILVTADIACVMTDEIEAQRLKDEEVSLNWTFHVIPWTEPQQREQFVREAASDKPVLSDRPGVGEQSLPAEAWYERMVLRIPERQRYRELGVLAASAMTEAMQAVRPEWSEHQVAGAGAVALWKRGIEPALTLVAGEQRLPRYRHATPSHAAVGQCAMMVFCARRNGLYANLTRFVGFGKAAGRQHDIMAVEAAALAACLPSRRLSAVYWALEDAYRRAGEPQAIRQHHQGGITGYLARELIAAPATSLPLACGMAVAFNPSFSGIKMEDTFLLEEGGLENLTCDPAWPAVNVEGRLRPLWLEVA